MVGVIRRAVGASAARWHTETVRATSTRHLWVLFLIAVLIRVGALIVIHPTGIGDNASEVYLPSARRIVAGLGFNDLSTREFSMAAPGYSYFLAGMFFLFGENFFLLRLVQMLLDAGTAVLLFLLAERLAGRKAAAIAFAGYAFYPLAVHYSLEITSESLFTFVQVATIAVFLEALRRQQTRWYVLVGALFTIATLIRSTALFLPVLFLPIVAATGKWKPRTWAWGALVVALTLVGPLAWGIRNQRVLGDFILVQTNSGSTFCHGADERFWTIESRTRYRDEFVHSLEPRGIIKPASGRESDIDHWYWRAGVERYRMRWEASPLGFIAFFAQKFFRVWYASEAGHSFLILGLMHFPLLGLFLCGCAARRRHVNAADIVMLGLVAYYILVPVITLPLLRYLTPAMPFVILYAGVGLLWLAARVAPSLRRAPEPSG